MDWIEKAFADAEKKNTDSFGIAYKIRGFLDENTPKILDQWAKVVGKEKSVTLAKYLSEHDDMNDLVETLTEVFTVAGYLFAKMEES